MKFAEQSAHLASGHSFVMYSDGLTEAKNEAGDFFGKERLISLLASTSGSPEQIGFSILQGVDRFTGSSTPSDDLSIIIAQKI